MQCPHCDTEFAPNIALQYQYCPCFGKVVRDREPLEIVWKSGLCGFRNRDGALITPIKYDDSYGAFFHGFTVIVLNGKKSLLDELGREVFPFYYDTIQQTKEGLCVVSLDGKYGIVDLRGNEVIPFVYDEAEDEFFEVGTLWMKRDNSWFLVDRLGREIVKDEHYSIDEPEEEEDEDDNFYSKEGPLMPF